MSDQREGGDGWINEWMTDLLRGGHLIFRSQFSNGLLWSKVDEKRRGEC
jgi:hypothetical protein